jgi:hypothetical protein
MSLMACSQGMMAAVVTGGRRCVDMETRSIESAIDLEIDSNVRRHAVALSCFALVQVNDSKIRQNAFWHSQNCHDANSVSGRGAALPGWAHIGYPNEPSGK